MTHDNLLQPLLEIAREAAARILEIYGREFTVEHKEDASPLTEADRASHAAIVRGLAALTPDIPVLSEESAAVPPAERRRWDTFWLVDPLDGTKEFIQRNGEFTVNIALVQEGRPIAGLVHVPVSGESYLACAGVGAFHLNARGERSVLRVAPLGAGPIRVVGSRSHRGELLDAYLARLGPHTLVSMGSSLKLCLVAAGKADVYPRLGPTFEWDTAAAQCVVECAGGQVIACDTGEPLRYNRRDTLVNPFFIAYGDPRGDWLRHLQAN
ncbi:MAG TPA: 3'(2'),5'-bisphosphate nucleotidase CysQ [Gammaproteobacteria bacterium]|nr:3'(2'),5'-bisphosphate nucleotidase CysQ [Gammaproteobacteria bacterium]